MNTCELTMTLCIVIHVGGWLPAQNRVAGSWLRPDYNAHKNCSGASGNNILGMTYYVGNGCRD